MTISKSARTIKRRQQQSALNDKLKSGSEKQSDPPGVPQGIMQKDIQERKKIAQAMINDIPGLPNEGRPWSLAQGEGRFVLDKRALTEHQSQTVLVEIDAGAFRWLWEGAETRALDNYRRYSGVSGADVISDAGIRAVEALRKAGHSNWPSKYKKPGKKRIVRSSTSTKTTTKRIIKKKSSSIEEEPNTKRVLKRKKS